MSYVYVASSWRNERHPIVCEMLESAGVDHYNFKTSGPSGAGFQWREVMGPSYQRREHNEVVQVQNYLEALQHERTFEAFTLDMGSLMKADTTVAILPCNRSAHLELGWAAGAGQRTAILLDPDDDGNVTPELMYKMLDRVFSDIDEMVEWIKDQRRS